jgi:hypothetical protein
MTPRQLFQVLAVLMCFLLVPALLEAQGKGKGKGKGHGQEAAESDEGPGRPSQGGPVFNDRHRVIIRDYFHNNYSNLPPGLAKRGGNLPPGLQKQLERNGTLPPGLQKRVQPFPADLRSRLPRLPSGYDYGVIGPDAIILDSRTQRIVDVIHAVIGR